MLPDPAKTSVAVAEMERPQSITELRRFMGMVNWLGKFTPNMAELARPLRELLSDKKRMDRGPHQEKSFHQIKAELTKPTVLAPRGISENQFGCFSLRVRSSSVAVQC